MLRQPIEDRKITVARAKYTVDYPASFMLVASMNPCPCGYYGHPTKRCTCTSAAVNRYMNRISGPLLDRIDLHVEIQPVAFDELASMQPGEGSAEIRRRVMSARQIQQERYKDEKGIHCNAQMNSRLIRKYAWPDAEGLRQLKIRMEKLGMTARAFDRILRVARTIADLEYAAAGISAQEAAALSLKSAHLTEAISYRNLDRAAYGSTF